VPTAAQSPDIAQSLGFCLSVRAERGDVAIITHSKGGLVLLRYLAWMLNAGRGRELARIRVAVMLSCPNEGSEYLRAFRAAAGFGRHPQARNLKAFSEAVADARHTQRPRSARP
jgi:triacylglycerol esterase/lipase EstA (alpha/beta hydrolase family)